MWASLSRGFWPARVQNAIQSLLSCPNFPCKAVMSCKVKSCKSALCLSTGSRQQAWHNVARAQVNWELPTAPYTHATSSVSHTPSESHKSFGHQTCRLRPAKRDWWTGGSDGRVGNCHWLDSKSGCLQQSSPFGSPPFSQQLHLDVIDTFSNDASSACPTGDWPVCQPLPLQHEVGKGGNIQN